MGTSSISFGYSCRAQKPGKLCYYQNVERPPTRQLASVMEISSILATYARYAFQYFAHLTQSVQVVRHTSNLMFHPKSSVGYQAIEAHSTPNRQIKSQLARRLSSLLTGYRRNNYHQIRTNGRGSIFKFLFYLFKFFVVSRALLDLELLQQLTTVYKYCASRLHKNPQILILRCMGNDDGAKSGWLRW